MSGKVFIITEVTLILIYLVGRHIIIKLILVCSTGQDIIQKFILFCVV